MHRTLREISHLFLSDSQGLSFPPSPPSLDPAFDPEQLFAADQLFPSHHEWEQILHVQRVARALIAGLLVHLEPSCQEWLVGRPGEGLTALRHHPAQEQNLRTWLAELEHMAAGLEGSFGAVDLREAVQAASNRLQPSFVSRRIRYSQTIPERLPQVLGVAQQLTELVEHLLRNSLEATAAIGPEREVRLSLQFTAEDLFLTVGDNGEGLSADILARMFFPFFSTRRQSGLGLFWVSQILEIHRGRLKLWSQPAVGTEVYLRLPVNG